MELINKCKQESNIEAIENEKIIITNPLDVIKVDEEVVVNIGFLDLTLQT